MNTCDTCKWWDQHGERFYGPRGHWACNNPKLQEDNEGEDELGYDYNEGGSFHTGPKFGCIHHEPK